MAGRKELSSIASFDSFPNTLNTFQLLIFATVIKIPGIHLFINRVDAVLMIRGKSPKKVFVLSGRVVVSDKPCVFVTILGSCVSVCLWDKNLMTGGINHFLLPETVNDAKSLHGGIASTRLLIDSMLRQGSNIKNLVAQVFGGANRFFTEQSFLNVGRQNVQAAKIILDERGIRAVHHDTGGELGRKLYFNTRTGKVTVIRINYTEPEFR